MVARIACALALFLAASADANLGVSQDRIAFILDGLGYALTFQSAGGSHVAVHGGVVLELSGSADNPRKIGLYGEMSDTDMQANHDLGAFMTVVLATTAPGISEGWLQRALTAFMGGSELPAVVTLPDRTVTLRHNNGALILTVESLR